MPRAAIYARKSSESDDRQCLSLSAQIDWAQTTCMRLDIREPLLFQESRSAKTPGRPEFARLMALVKAGEVDMIVCWKADRLARNAADAGTVLFALESKGLRQVVTSDRSYTNEADSELMLGIELGFSAKYSKDLSKNVRRGLAEKWRRGEWSFAAPVGYRNVRLSADRGVIEVDPKLAPVVKRLFELAATGNYSLNRLATLVRDEWHVTLRPNRCTKSSRGVSPSAIDKILRNPFYIGVMRVKGEIYQGSHEPLVSRTMFSEVRRVMAARNRTAERPKKLTFAFNGILRCSECGRRLSGYLKTKPSGKTYTYYVCGKHLQGGCSQPQLSEPEITSAILAVLDSVTLSERELAIVQGELWELRGRLYGDLQAAKGRLEAELTDLDIRQSKLLDLFLAEGINRDEFDRKKRDIEGRRSDLLLSADAEANPAEMFEPVQNFFSTLLDAGNVFRRAEADGKRELLRKLGFELVARGKETHLDAGKPAAIVGDRGGQPLWWRLVDEVWNCVVVRRKIANLIGALWNAKNRRLGYEFL